MTSKKINKIGMISIILIVAALLFVPAIAFAEGDTDDAAESSSGSAESSDSGSTDSGSTDSDSSTTESLSSSDDSAVTDDSSGSEDANTDSEGQTDSEDSTTESLAAKDDSDGTDDSSGSEDANTDSEEKAGSEDSTTESLAAKDDSDGTDDSSGSGGNSYTAEITPDDGLVANEPTDFTVTFTEVGEDTTLGSAQIIIPDEFTSISLGDITASDGNWSGGLVDQVISLWADTPDDYLGQNESVSAVFTATTPEDPGDYTFQTLAWTDSKVNLGTAESYAVLADDTITNTGETTIIGDIGLHPGTSITGYDDVGDFIVHTGELNLTNEAAEQAKNDLQIAYTDAANRPGATEIPTELNGQNLTPGVYNSASGTFGLTGELTLSADNPNDAFIFQMESTLITGAESNIVLDDQATFCQVFWQVGSSATLGTDSTFVGHILAQESITATTDATVIGQLLALNGAVTLDSNTITNEPCETNINAPAAGYDETLSVTIDNGNGNGNGNGTENGTGYTGPGVTPLGAESILGTDTDSQVSPGEIALPATGGYPIAEVLSGMVMALMAISGVLIKKKLI